MTKHITTALTLALSHTKIQFERYLNNILCKLRGSKLLERASPRLLWAPRKSQTRTHTWNTQNTVGVWTRFMSSVHIYIYNLNNANIRPQQSFEPSPSHAASCPKNRQLYSAWEIHETSSRICVEDVYCRVSSLVVSVSSWGLKLIRICQRDITLPGIDKVSSTRAFRQCILCSSQLSTALKECHAFCSNI